MPTVSLPITLEDGEGFVWEINQNGQVYGGPNDAYDGAGGLFLRDFPNFSNAETEDNEREIVLGPAPITGLDVVRKIYVPEDQGWVRYLEVFTNSSDSTISYTAWLDTELGSNGSTQTVGTSSGDQRFNRNDMWIVTDDRDDGDGDPTMLHVVAGERGEIRPSYAEVYRDDINVFYDLALQPGETQIIMHFAAQNKDQQTALGKADALAKLGSDAIEGISREELIQIVNFPKVISGTNEIDNLRGDEAPNIILGLAGADTLQGEGGDDLIEGGADGDQIVGGAGEDTLTGGGGADTLSGGEDADSFVFTQFETTDDVFRDLITDYDASAGDVIKLEAGVAITASGLSSGGDLVLTLTGDDEVELSGVATLADVVFTREVSNQDDSIDGTIGNDLIEARDGNDTITGLEGSDTLVGDNGDDLVSGGDGEDSLEAGSGRDTVSGGGGNDTIAGGDDGDDLQGGAGNDAIDGDAGNDLVRGEDGDDRIDGGRGEDSLFGGEGDDVLRGGLSSAPDILYGGAGNDKLNGEGGDDVLAGDAGNDTIDGNGGDDYIQGGSGNDSMTGAEGRDAFSFLASEAADGISDLDIIADYSPTDGDALFLSAGVIVEDSVVDETEGNLTLTLTGGDQVRLDGITDVNDVTVFVGETAFDDSIIGGSGADTLSGLDGDDTIRSDEGNDLLDGDAGRDLLNGQAGNDTLDGGGQDDTLLGGDGGDIIFGGAYPQSGLDLNEDEPNDRFADRNTFSATVSGVTTFEVRGELAPDGGDVDYFSFEGLIPGLTYVADIVDSPADTTLGLFNESGTLLDVDDDDGSGVLSSLTFNVRESGEINLAVSGYRDLEFVGSHPETGQYTLRVFVPGPTGVSDNDSISGENGDDFLYGGRGNDFISGDLGNDTIDGGGGRDTAIGDDGDDVIDVGSNNDVVSGGTGSDSIDGSWGSDELHGDEGGDTIIGGSGDDSVWGDDGNDSIDAGEDRDVVYGGLGTDLILGGAGSDELHGDQAADTIEGNGGSDSITGGDGNDSISAGNNNDTVDGGLGNDTVQSGYGSDLLEGGDGDDVLDGEDGNDTIAAGLGLDSVSGGQGDDNLSGDAGADTLLGGDGNDVISGGDDDDVINGEDGNDTISGELGADSIDGGIGRDSLLGGDGADTIVGNVGRDTLEGSEGGDSVVGGDQDDSISGGIGSDTLVGGAGGDLFIFGGVEASNGIAELDTITDFDPVEGDAVYLKDGVTVTDTNVESGNVVLTLTGEDKVQFEGVSDPQDIIVALVGGNGPDSIEGTDDNDRMVGLGGRDTLSGFEGDDTLDGGSNNDTLHGGQGSDVLIGGTDADLFVFSAEAGAGSPLDIVDDFEDDVDRIDLNAFGFTDLDALAPHVEALGRNTLLHLGAVGGEDVLMLGLNVFELSPRDVRVSGDDNFDGGALGWSQPITTDGGRDLSTFLGRFGGGSGPISEKTFRLPEGTDQVTISFDFFELDSWEADGGDKFSVFIDGEIVLEEDFDHRLNDETAEGNTGDFSWRIEPLTSGGSDLGFSSTSDQIHRVTIEMENPDASFVLGFGSSLNQELEDESFGIDNLSVDAIDNVSDEGSGSPSVSGFGALTLNAVSSDVEAYQADFIFNGSSGVITGTEGADMITPDAISGGVDGGTPSAGDDTVDALGGNDTVDGGGGADSLDGGNGDDSLLGGTGNDRLKGGWGLDTLDGGAGNDTVDFSYNGYSAAIIDLATGEVEFPETGLIETLTSIENVTGTNGDNLINGTDGANRLEGVGGTDTLQGGLGFDTLDGGDGNDSLLGGDGNDMLNGGWGLDTLDGGAGNDTVDFSYSYSSAIIDLATGEVEFPETGSSESLTSIENVIGTNGENFINGTDGANRLQGGGGDDTLRGGHGYDTLDGGAGRDTADLSHTSANAEIDLAAGQVVFAGGVEVLIGIENAIGTNGVNYIIGSSASNVIDGAGGVDDIAGGLGNDYFVLRSGDGADHFFDYVDGVDKFLLDGITYDALDFVARDSDTKIQIHATEEVIGIIENTAPEVFDDGDFDVI